MVYHHRWLLSLLKGVDFIRKEINNNKKAYDRKPANFYIDEESEKIAYEKGMRKLAKKKQGTN